MASYAQWDNKNGRFVLGPPLIPAQEIYQADSTMNPAFELSYWTYGLKTTQTWRKRLGLLAVEKWDHILNNLAKIPVNDSLYQNMDKYLFQCGFKKWFKPSRAEETIFYLANEQDEKLRMSKK
jgi:hypothetical protein